MASGLHYTPSPAQRVKGAKEFKESAGECVEFFESFGHKDIANDIKHASENGLSGKGVATVIAELAKRAGFTAADLREEVDSKLPATRGVFAQLEAAEVLERRRDKRAASDATAVVDPKALADAKRAADAIAAELIAEEAKEKAKTKSGAASGGGAPTRKTSKKKPRK